MGGQQLGFSCKGNREPLQGMRRGETGEVYSPRDLKWRPGYLSESKPSRAQISGYSRRSSDISLTRIGLSAPGHNDGLKTLADTEKKFTKNEQRILTYQSEALTLPVTEESGIMEDT